MPKLPKSERLSRQKIIDSLFSKGDKFLIYPFSVRFIICEDEMQGADVVFVVPKRFIKKAVARNHIKRLLRETYRLQKDEFLSVLNFTNQRLHISISLVTTQDFSFAQMQDYMSKMLSKLQTQLRPNEMVTSDL
ncbi:MAG: ribonuclease P protein component [Bacteroidales bacterium]|jgi:ribonuclease P protein component|nr:ribonuclease P protein component [Bacteroidales bacterium]